jgi:hypothetical protein
VGTPRLLVPTPRRRSLAISRRPEPFQNPRRPSLSPGRDYNRPCAVTSHLDPRTRASVLPPRKDPIGGASTLEEARESYRAKLAALLGAGRHEMPSVIEHLRAQPGGLEQT